MISFKKFTKIDSEIFKSLNLEWLNSYFEVEPIDKVVLNNPKIDKKLVIKELQKRDQRDMERSAAPLKIAKDAIVIDTTDLTIEEVNSIVQREIEKVIK